MGLFDTLAKEFIGKLGGGGQNPLLNTIMGMLSNPQTGGIQGLVDAFKSKGLGDVISSWIGTGENQPISGDQIKNVLGLDQIRNVAEKAGISQDEATGGLASLLPQIIDKLTPNGKLPESGLLDEAMKMLKGKTGF
jgi:uncharacterized protein YidB (DUF937 family)